MRNLLIIGNGFDLSHNLETSYKDFLIDVIDSEIKNKKEYPNYFKLSVWNISSDASQILTKIKNGNSVSNFFSIKNRFFGDILKATANNWYDIESLYFKKLDEICSPSLPRLTENKENEYNSVTDLNVEFDEVKRGLEYYLTNKLSEQSLINVNSTFFNKIDSVNTLVLNFNYTETIKKYFVNPKSKIIAIHGELNRESNKIIFGYSADHEETKNFLEEENSYEFMRNIKRHRYMDTNNEEELKDYLKIEKDINVSVLGHSCGISDRLILKQIFTNKNVKSIRVFYNNNKLSFEKTLARIDRILNNEDDFGKIKNYTKSISLPQITDDNQTKIKFQDFINENYKVTSNIRATSIKN